MLAVSRLTPYFDNHANAGVDRFVVRSRGSLSFDDVSEAGGLAISLRVERFARVIVSPHLKQWIDIVPGLRLITADLLVPQ